MKINKREFQKRQKDGYISCRKHPKADLYICNYTQRCQYENFWDEHTLLARGLIIDYDGNIKSMGFKKFFNIGEKEETFVKNLPLEKPTVWEKLDGFYLITYPYKKETRVASRGSFDSPHAIWGNAWLKKNKLHRADFKPDYSYIFEGITPKLRIVVDYRGREEMVLLAVRNIQTGEYINHIKEAKRLGFSYAKPIKFMNIDHILDYVNHMNSDEEGFVLRYKSGLMAKIKSKEYLRLHKLIYGFSTISIWECLKNNQDIDEFIKDIPDEFYKWIREQQRILQSQFDGISYSMYNVYEKVKKLPSKKEQAICLSKKYGDYAPLIFMLLNGKSPDELIWKRIRPQYEKPLIKE